MPPVHETSESKSNPGKQGAAVLCLLNCALTAVVISSLLVLACEGSRYWDAAVERHGRLEVRASALNIDAKHRPRAQLGLSDLSHQYGSFQR